MPRNRRTVIALVVFASCAFAFVPRPARAAGCPVILDRVIATSPVDHVSNVTLTFLANAPTFTSVDIAGRWTRGKTLSHQTPFDLQGHARPYVSNVFTAYDDRTHGALVDAWISDVTEKDGTHLACAHRGAMQRRADRVFRGALELVSIDALTPQNAAEKSAEIAFLSATPAPTASPTAASSAQPGGAIARDLAQVCATPDAPAAVVNYVRPIYPDMAREQGAVGTALVLVNVDEQGIDRSQRIYKSAGNAQLDMAALGAARASTYQAAIANCYAVPGQYFFRADFTGQ